MQSYIVRIYRKEEKKSRELVGLVQEVGEQDSKAFTSYEELWEILKASQPSMAPGRPAKPDEDGK